MKYGPAYKTFPSSDTFAMAQKSVVSGFPAVQRQGSGCLGFGGSARKRPPGASGRNVSSPLAEVGPPEMRPLPASLKAQAPAAAVGDRGWQPGQAGPLQVCRRGFRAG